MVKVMLLILLTNTSVLLIVVNAYHLLCYNDKVSDHLLHVKVRSPHWQKRRTLKLLDDGVTIWCQSHKTSSRAKEQQSCKHVLCFLYESYKNLYESLYSTLFHFHIMVIVGSCTVIYRLFFLLHCITSIRKHWHKYILKTQNNLKVCFIVC